MGILDLLLGKKEKPGGLTCTNCKAYIPEGALECPKCRKKVKEMFKVTCPNCKKEIEWDAERCEHCGKDFKPEKKSYKCPMCGYEANYPMLNCPACGARFA